MAVTRNTIIQHFIKKKILPLAVNEPSRKLHCNLLENTSSKPTLSQKNETIENSAKKQKETKHNESEESHDKKIEYKDWKTTDTSWLGRDQTEGELVKHIEILQRFTERYNSTIGHRSEGDKSNSDSHKKMKIIDRPSNQSYSTMVKLQPAVKLKKKSKPKIKRTKSQPNSKTYITLANEPRASVEPSRSVSVVPNVLDYPNPDTVQFDYVTNCRLPKPRLYSIVSKWDETAKKTVPRRQLSIGERTTDHRKGKRAQQEVSDFFKDRFNPTSMAEKRKQISKASTNKLTEEMKQTLVETRKSAPSVDKLESVMKKPPVLVKESHLPLQRCRKTSQSATDALAPQSFGRTRPTSHRSKTSQSEPPNKGDSKSNILNKLIKYFKR